MLFYCLY